jgi:L-threonylcarbamoyladenylate synthase
MNQKEALDKALEILKRGGVIIAPSDGMYGLSCDATNAKAVERIIQLKGSIIGRGFLVLLSSDRMFNQCYKEIPGVAWDMVDLADKPLSIVLEEGRYVAPNVLHHDGSLGSRMLRNGAAFDLVQKLGRPMLSTAASFEGEPLPLKPDQIDGAIQRQVDFVYPVFSEKDYHTSYSKIVRIAMNGEVRIIRK